MVTKKSMKRLKKPEYSMQENKVRTETVFVTPAMAKEWMAKNIHNRNVSDQVVASYARDMRLGRWVLNHQGIAFDNEGNLMDGQHRLLAIIQSGVTVQLLVTFGLPKVQINDKGEQVKTMLTGDCGRPRSVAARLYLEYGFPNINVRCAAMASVVGLALSNGIKIKLSTGTMLAVMDIYGTSFDLVYPELSKNRLNLVSPCIAAVTMYAKAFPQHALEFSEKLSSLENLNAGHPCLLLHKFLSEYHGETGSSAWLVRAQTTVSAICKYEHNQKAGVLRPSVEAAKWLLSTQPKAVKAIKAIFQ